MTRKKLKISPRHAYLWFALLVDDDPTIWPLIDTTHTRHGQHIGTRTGQTLEQMQSRYAYLVAIVTPARAERLAVNFYTHGGPN